jgi:hypothetical protein
MSRGGIVRLWAANFALIVALSVFGRRLQRAAAATVSRETLGALVIIALVVALVGVLVALRLGCGRDAALRATVVVPLLALGLWLVPLPEEQLHFLVFGVFGALTFALFAPGRATAIAIAVAIADELLQGALPDRFFDVRDIAMNSASALAGGWLLRGT